MKKLKNKIFITIFIILTISILTILVIFNSTNYIREKSNVKNNLSNTLIKKDNDLEPPEKPDNDNQSTPPEIPNRASDNPRFMDVTIYTVLLDDDEISTIISHTKDETIPEEINTFAKSILKSNKKGLYIKNLYFNKYSYRYLNDEIIIIDNSEINGELKADLLMSVLIFILFEIFAYIISLSISKWIIKPVEASFNKQKQFIADASHELKTPLAVIMASADALETDKNEKWLKNIQSESNRMSNLIKDLLDLAKLEKEDIQIIKDNNNLSKLVELAIAPFESLIYEKNIKLKCEIEENINWQCNSEQIKQLIAILLDNAIKHSKEQGKIIVTLNREKDNVTIKVQNIGDPIPDGEEEKIFERFYRVDKARNRNDNRYGLGLAIAKGIVERHNGTIKAKSEKGTTTFKIILKK